MNSTPRRIRQIIASFVISALCLGQVACVQPTVISSGNAPQCQLNVQARAPLTEWGQHFVVPVTLNDKNVNLVVDTGAQLTMVTPELDADLQLPANQFKRYRPVSLGGGSGDKYKHVISSMKIGALEWKNMDVGVDQILTDKQRGNPASPGGLLGVDAMSAGYDVELNFPARTMTFYRTSGCRGEFVPWHGKYMVFQSGYWAARHFFMIPILIDGHSTRAILDTGSMITMVTRASALAAGVTAAALDNDRLLAGLQSAGTSYDAHLHQFDTLDIGGTRLRHVAIQVTDSSLPGVDMLLGMDFLRNQRIWLSYGTGQVFMQRVQPPLATQGALQN